MPFLRYSLAAAHRLLPIVPAAHLPPFQYLDILCAPMDDDRRGVQEMVGLLVLTLQKTFRLTFTDCRLFERLDKTKV